MDNEEIRGSGVTREAFNSKCGLRAVVTESMAYCFDHCVISGALHRQ